MPNSRSLPDAYFALRASFSAAKAERYDLSLNRHLAVCVLAAVLLAPCSVLPADRTSCPQQFSDFLAVFERDPQFQVRSIRFPLRMAYVDGAAQPEPKRKTKSVSRKEYVDSEHPFYPTPAIQAQRKLEKKVKNLAPSKATVRFDQPDSDAYSIEYRFEKKDDCWELTFMEDYSL